MISPNSFVTTIRQVSEPCILNLSKFVNMPGKCTRGNKCRFRHVDEFSYQQDQKDKFITIKKVPNLVTYPKNWNEYHQSSTDVSQHRRELSQSRR